MKKLLATMVFITLLVAPLYAAQWCEWSGTEGINCKSDTDGKFRLPNGVYVAERDFNEYGYYELTTTHPALGVNQVRDAIVWDLVGNQMSRTWTVRDMTATEIDEVTARAMPLSEYYLWIAFTHPTLGIYTRAQLANVLPQELIDAFLARDRLENP